MELLLDQTPNLEKRKQVTRLLFDLLITVIGMEQGLHAIRLILFIEIGVKMTNF